jgi:hypothetical protein
MQAGFAQLTNALLDATNKVEGKRGSPSTNVPELHQTKRLKSVEVVLPPVGE